MPISDGSNETDILSEIIFNKQARAFKISGSVAESERKARFITFCANNAYKAETNRYEEAAYRFGGAPDRPHDFYLEQSGSQRPAPSTPILQDSSIPDFWS
jgi:hypothetical protein